MSSSTMGQRSTPDEDRTTRLRQQLDQMREQMGQFERQMRDQMLMAQGIHQMEQQRLVLKSIQAMHLEQEALRRQLEGLHATPQPPSAAPTQDQPSAAEPAARSNQGAGEHQEMVSRLQQLQQQLLQQQRQTQQLAEELRGQIQQNAQAAPPANGAATVQQGGGNGPVIVWRRQPARAPQPQPEHATTGLDQRPQREQAAPEQPQAPGAQEQRQQPAPSTQQGQQSQPQGQQGRQNQPQGQHGQQPSDEEEDEEPRGQRLTTYMAYVGTVVAVGGFLFGYDTGLVSGAQLYYVPQFHMDKVTQEVSVGAVLIGAFLGALVAGPIANWLGRRRGLILMAYIFGLGAILTAISWNSNAIIIFRIVTGLAVGGASVISPMYSTEASPPKYRGSMVFLFQGMVAFGLLIAYLLDLWMVKMGWDWRPMFGSALVPAILFGLGIYFLSDTPRWLAMQGRWDEASAVMRKVVGSDPTDEMRMVRERIEATEHSRWTELFRPGLRVALVVAVGLALLQQFVGINTIIYYAPLTVHNVSHGVPMLVGGVIAGLVNLGGAITAILIAPYVGRRVMLIGGTFGILCTLAGLGAFFATGTIYHAGILPIVTLMLYLVCFELGLGPIFWLMSGELFPTRLRGYGESIASWANWVGNMIVTMTYLTEVTLAGGAWTMWQFAFIALLGLFFIIFLVPETKDRPLEMIEAYWTNGRSWRKVERKQRREQRHKQQQQEGGQAATA